MPDERTSQGKLKLSKSNDKLSSREPKALLKTLIALLLVTLCVIAANWQYDRGIARNAKNGKVEANVKKPIVPLISITDISRSEWQLVTVNGTFKTEHEVLLRNRYNSEGKYGFQYLTLFETSMTSQKGTLSKKRFWVDRGWVQAGATALTRPEIPTTPAQEITIIGRIRLDNALPKGSFFALPPSGDLINSWDLRSKVRTENFYLDLIDGTGVKPKTPAQLPELSDGPHFAYALQWLFFAGLAIYGRYLIRKR